MKKASRGYYTDKYRNRLSKCRSCRATCSSISALSVREHRQAHRLRAGWVIGERARDREKMEGGARQLAIFRVHSVTKPQLTALLGSYSSSRPLTSSSFCLLCLFRFLFSSLRFRVFSCFFSPFLPPSLPPSLQPLFPSSVFSRRLLRSDYFASVHVPPSRVRILFLAAYIRFFHYLCRPICTLSSGRHSWLRFLPGLLFFKAVSSAYLPRFPFVATE